MAESRDPNTLTKRQQRFVDEFLVDGNATRAAIRAGYATSSASVQGSRLIGDANVAAEIASREADMLKACRLRAYRVLNEVAIIAHSDPDDYTVSDEGVLTLSPGAPPDAMRAVASIKRKVVYQKNGSVERTVEYRLWDKNSALDKAMKHLGIISDKVDHTSGGKPISFTLRIGERPNGADDE